MGRNFGKGNYPTIWSGGGRIRNRQRERLFLIAAAGLCFSLLLILVFVFNFRSEAKATVGPVQVLPSANSGYVTLLSPEHTVNPGEPLANVRLKEIFWPRNQVPEGAVRDVAEVQGMYASVTLSPQTPLQRANLTKERSQIVLPVTLHNRAVAIEVDDTADIEGHALPGTRVDVVLTYYNKGNLISQIIVQNARIISAGGDTTSVNDMSNATAGARHASRTLTLDVIPTDALKIETSRQLGRLSLLMRHGDDNEGVKTTSVDADYINGNKKNIVAKPTCHDRMRSGGKEYVVCDGSLTEVPNQNEP